MQDQAQKQAELLKQVEILEKVAKQQMSKEAIARYGNLKSAHLEKAIQAITTIVQAIQAGQLQEPLSDDDFKLLLQRMEKKNTWTMKR